LAATGLPLPHGHGITLLAATGLPLPHGHGITLCYIEQSPLRDSAYCVMLQQ
jgi:phage tail protein X